MLRVESLQFAQRRVMGDKQGQGFDLQTGSGEVSACVRKNNVQQQLAASDDLEQQKTCPLEDRRSERRQGSPPRAAHCQRSEMWEMLPEECRKVSPQCLKVSVTWSGTLRPPTPALVCFAGYFFDYEWKKAGQNFSKWLSGQRFFPVATQGTESKKKNVTSSKSNFRNAQIKGIEMTKRATVTFSVMATKLFKLMKLPESLEV